MVLREKLEANGVRLFIEEEHLAPALFAMGEGEVALCSRSNPASDDGSPNEDASALISVGSQGMVLAVADGLGGARAGQQASALAVQCLVEAVRDAAREGREVRAGILDGFDRGNEKVMALGLGAATTLTVAEVERGSVRTYHVGDSFLLVTGARGRVKLKTIPHSPVGYGIESGLLDAEDAMGHHERHFVSNVIGSADMRIDVGSPVELSRHDTLVLGSDGLSDNLLTEEIVTCVRKGPLDAASRELLRRATERMEGPDGKAPSKPDDLTFLI
ncbi:MAG: PP2C family protein-serine/threonine phosphatase, partial [Vicinamibacteria bacterium]